jgi:DNA-binding transcriptional regulator GbsR (MarR family)
MSAGRLPERGTDWRHRFVEDMGGLVLVHGTPRAMMRVLGWMVVCEPQEQTAADIQRELDLSAGSVSTSLRMLGDIGMLERVARPSDRHIYYRLNRQGWELVLEARFRAFNEIRRVADRAVTAAGDEANERLMEMRDTWAFLESGGDELLKASRLRRDDPPISGAVEPAVLHDPTP